MAFQDLYEQAMEHHAEQVTHRLARIIAALAGTGIRLTGNLDHVLTECTIDTDNVHQVSRAARVLEPLGYQFGRSGAGETVFQCGTPYDREAIQ